MRGGDGGDGHGALSLARLNTYDAMLADIRLPDMGGFDVYRELHRSSPTPTSSS